MAVIALDHRGELAGQDGGVIVIEGDDDGPAENLHAALFPPAVSGPA